MPSSTYYAVLLALVLGVGCGGGDITQCYWCKEDIKKGALICKHCGKTPNENGADQEPDKTIGSEHNTKPPVDTWASKSHPDQVTIREVETDKGAFENKRFIIKGSIKVSSNYPIGYFKSGDTFHASQDYAFEISDETGTAYAYYSKSDPDIQVIRSKLLNEPSGQLRGFFVLSILSYMNYDNERNVYALFGGQVPDKAINQGTSSSSKDNEPKSTQSSVGGAEKGSSDKTEKLGIDPIVEAAIRMERKKPEGELDDRDLRLVNYGRFSGMNLTELPKGLEKLRQLYFLYLSGNQLTDVKDLEGFTQLRELRLSHNQLTDVKGLEKLTKLRWLYLVDNPDLTKAQIDELQKALPDCTIYLKDSFMEEMMLLILIVGIVIFNAFEKRRT
jgi:hypothetical protein